jgi:hypothetical protein
MDVRADAAYSTARGIAWNHERLRVPARSEGATDLEIHDTVLIAAAFCMYNRYVDGSATFTPTDPKLYDEMGARMADEGYVEQPSPRQPAARR